MEKLQANDVANLCDVWEGYITEIGYDTFWCRIVSLGEADLEYETEFPLSVWSERDKEALEPGLFFWIRANNRLHFALSKQRFSKKDIKRIWQAAHDLCEKLHPLKEE